MVISSRYPWHLGMLSIAPCQMSPCWTPWWGRTLDDEYIIFNMAHTNQPKKRKDNIEETMNDLSIASENWPHFLVIESGDQNRPVTSLSPFVLDKALKACAGTVKGVQRLRSGVLLVEVTREAQATNLLKLKTILDLNVTVSAHRTMNSCKGVIRSYDLAQIDETELVSELKSQNVTEVKPIFITRNGQKKNKYSDSDFLPGKHSTVFNSRIFESSSASVLSKSFALFQLPTFWASSCCMQACSGLRILRHCCTW